MRRSFLGSSLVAVALVLGCSGGDSTSDDFGDTGADTDEDTAGPVCGDGKKEGSELCDDGNLINGDGCESDCTYTCKEGTAEGNRKCDDGNPCNGTETCGAGNKCVKGTALMEGASCGMGKLCKAGLCTDITCGDAVVTAPEECDDGNVTNGDGCDSCKFSCVSSDMTRNCKSADACRANGTCDDAKHTCTPGAPVADGTACGSGMVCKAGVCTAGSCGNGTVEAGEQCDFGTGNGAGTGCEVDCKFSCSKTPTDTCVDTNPCNGTEVCANVTVGTGTGQKCSPGTNLADGTACGGGKVCKAGVCTSASCGNGTVEAGEECDWGTANGPNAGCETTCKFSCTKAPDSCPDTNACNGAEVCTDVTVGGKAGRKCNPGTNAAKCTACAGGGVCDGAGVCKTSTCGDGCVDATKGETCDPPATGTCDAMCKKPAVCGNGTREAGEQCDDGNTTNLDGCDSACKYEHSHRGNSVTMQFGTDAFCAANRLGSAIASAGQSQIQTALSDGVKNGTTNILFKFLNLDDLSGTSDSMITLGGLGGKPVAAPTGVTYNGNSDLDWWYTVDPVSIDASRNPPAAAQINGSIAAKVLTAGPGRLTIVLAFSTGATSPLTMSGVNIKATIGTANAPLKSTGSTPGHLASENLDPALTSFATMSNGQLCGNVSAFSLSKVPVPAALLPGGAGACTEGYTMSNSLLDVLVNGCRTLGGIIAVVNKTQPDKDDTSVGTGHAPPYTLTVAASGKTVNSCKSSSGTYAVGTADFETCLKHASYSSYFKFTTDRVIIK
jgi:cysteine-rich repeat protein